MLTYADLNEEVSQVLFELWDVLIEAEQSLNEHFDLCTVHSKQQMLNSHNSTNNHKMLHKVTVNITAGLERFG